MNTLNHSTPGLVSKHGAPANSILRGCGISNQGLRVRILQAQPRDKDGPLLGPFIILDAGKNRHTQALTSLLNRETDGQEVLALIRKDHPACVSVVNANILVLEEKSQPANTNKAIVSDPDRAPLRREPLQSAGVARDVGTVSDPDF
jgi:hypothetical protein